MDLKPMKFWLMKNLQPDFGQTRGLVVKAENEERARSIAAGVAYGEGRAAWLDPSRTSAEVMDALGVEMVILASYAD